MPAGSALLESAGARYGGRIGAQVPRTRVVPASLPGSGEAAAAEVIELCAAYGRHLDPWQRLALADSLGESFDEMRQRRRWAAFAIELMAVRQVGKGGGVLEPRALGGMHLFGERRIVWSTHRLRSATDALARMRLYYDSNDELRKQVKRINESHTDMFIELYGETANERMTGLRRIEFCTRTGHTARGLSGDCVIVDEAYSASRTMIGALVPILATLPDPQLWLTSTPPLDTIAEEARADPETAGGMPMFDLKARALAGESDICLLDWSPEFDLDQAREVEADRRRAGLPPIREDIDLWYQCVPALGIRIDETQVRHEAGVMSLRQFCRERLGAWPPCPKLDEERERPIPEAAWEANIAEDERRPAPVSLAIEAAPRRAFGAIMLYGERPDRGPDTGQVETVEHGPGIGWIPGRLRDLIAAHDPITIVIAARGPAAPIIEEIKKLGIVEPEDRVTAAKAERGGSISEALANELRKPRRGDLLVTSLVDDGHATAQFIDAVKAGIVLHLAERRLSASVEGAELRDIGDGASTWGRRSSSSDTSPVFGATLARYGHLQRAPLVMVEQVYDPVGNIR